MNHIRKIARQTLDAIHWAISLVRTYLVIAIDIAFLALIAGAIAPKLGLRVPYVPSTDAVQLAYLCGAWWLIKR